MKYIKKHLALIISLGFVAAIAIYTPWGKVLNSFGQLDALEVAELIALSVIYYALKGLRFWYILKAIKITKPLKPVIISYLAAQPVTLLPGGEIYRSHSLKRYTGVPVKESLPQFTFQGILEGLAMMTLAVISTLILGKLRLLFILLTIGLIALIIAIYRGHLEDFLQFLNHLPFVNINDKTIHQLNNRHQAAFSSGLLSWLYGLSLIIEVVGSVIAYVSVSSIGGHILAYQAVLIYVIPIVIGFVSLVPGGIGPSENIAVGLLLLSHNSVGTAVAGTLLMRLTIVGLGVIYGFLTSLLARPSAAPI